MSEQNLNNKKSSGTKKRIVIVPAIGLVIGLALIATGILKTNAIERNARVEKPVLEAELEVLEDQEFELEKQQRHIFEEQRSFTDEYYEIGRELEKLRDEISDIESRLRELKDLTFEKSENIPFIIFGVFIMLVSLMAGGIATAAAKARAAMPDALDAIKQAGTAAAKAPNAAVICPQCGATTLPDANGRCEYCGGAVWGMR